MSKDQEEQKAISGFNGSPLYGRENIMDHLQFSPKVKFWRPYTSKSMKTA
jgi:hypothetical protein